MPTPTILAKKEPSAGGSGEPGAGPSPSASPLHSSAMAPPGEAGLRHASGKATEPMSASGKLINEYLGFSYDSAFKVGLRCVLLGECRTSFSLTDLLTFVSYMRLLCAVVAPDRSKRLCGGRRVGQAGRGQIHNHVRPVRLVLA